MHEPKNGVCSRAKSMISISFKCMLMISGSLENFLAESQPIFENLLASLRLSETKKDGGVGLSDGD